jgi:hypothetical protein
MQRGGVLAGDNGGKCQEHYNERRIFCFHRNGVWLKTVLKYNAPQTVMIFSFVKNSRGHLSFDLDPLKKLFFVVLTSLFQNGELCFRHTLPWGTQMSWE